MIRSLWTATTGMEAQQVNMDVIANNLANVSTSGFKKSRADFQDLLYQKQKSAGATDGAGTQQPTGIQIGLGTRTAAIQKLFTIGDFQQTGNDLDLAIEGDGFFQVEMTNGETGYTRSGAFKKDGTGRLVTSNGEPIVPQIVIPEGSTMVTVAGDGTVLAFEEGSNEGTEVGTIELVNFSNAAGLESIGRNLYQETPSSGAPVTGNPGEQGLGGLAQGFLEGSNVSVMEEMVNMIASQRAYEATSKVIKSSDEMLQMSNNIA